MKNDLAQIVAEKMQVLPVEEQQKVVEFVDLLSKPKKQTLLEKLAVISSRVPDEVWEKVPTNGAKSIDHYLYGSPKRK